MGRERRIFGTSSFTSRMRRPFASKRPVVATSRTRRSWRTSCRADRRTVGTVSLTLSTSTRRGNQRKVQKGEAPPHDLVPRHSKDQEEDALLVQLRRSQEVPRRIHHLHSGYR